MPHAVPKDIGLQALILCGPGSSFPTFTSNPDENQKALLPIANRPMVWYPLDFCNRAGITDVALVCPPTAAEAIRTALKTNPFLTSLPAPTLLAPAALDHTTGTASLLRLPEVRAWIVADFAVLPCDLVCELGGERLLQAWMSHAASLADLLCDADLGRGFPGSGCGGSSFGRRPALHSGGLGVWYDTRTALMPPVKGEETDFVATVALPDTTTGTAPPQSDPSSSLIPYLERVVTAMPTDSLNDLAEEKNGYPVRHGLLRRYRRVRMRTTHRDAHIYVFPRWVMDVVQANPHMDSIGEDVVGWWAKADWQPRLSTKLGMDAVLATYGSASGTAKDKNSHDSNGGNADADSGTMDHGTDATSEATSEAASAQMPDDNVLTVDGSVNLATAVEAMSAADDTPAATAAKTSIDEATKGGVGAKTATGADPVAMPPILVYVHPSGPTAPLIRRVDTAQLLLAVSLQLAKLPSIEEVVAQGQAATTAAPFAHAKKVAYPEGIKARTTVTRADSLVSENVTVEEKVSIKECVIGANCQIHEGAKLHQCLLMEGVVVGKGCRLTRCILGKRSEIGAQSVLTDCEVQENLLVEPKTEEKENNFMSSEGLEATAEEMAEAMLDAEDDDGVAGHGI